MEVKRKEGDTGVNQREGGREGRRKERAGEKREGVSID